MVTGLLLLLFAMANSWAAELRVNLDSSSLMVGQTVSMQVQLIDGDSSNKPRFSVGEGLNVEFQGKSTQHVIQNIKSHKTVSYT